MRVCEIDRAHDQWPLLMTFTQLRQFARFHMRAHAYTHANQTQCSSLMAHLDVRDSINERRDGFSADSHLGAVYQVAVVSELESPDDYACA